MNLKSLYVFLSAIRKNLKLINLLKKHKYWVVSIILVILILLIAPLTYTFISTRGHRYDLSSSSIMNVPYHKIGIVFGAGILANGQPTTYLKYRLNTAITLFKAHRVSILLMSGDNSTVAHNEPLVMKNYALRNGVPLKDIVLDDAGFDTYDTCYRAYAIFGITNATLVSQGYHLPRAMTTCKGLGISNIGVIAIHPTHDYTISYILRELVSTDKMVFQLAFKPKPAVLGKPLSLTSQN
jgi:vancomycin permeability regulator SanA